MSRIWGRGCSNSDGRNRHARTKLQASQCPLTEVERPWLFSGPSTDYEMEPTTAFSAPRRHGVHSRAPDDMQIMGPCLRFVLRVAVGYSRWRSQGRSDNPSAAISNPG
jgi:hypothetical protein